MKKEKGKRKKEKGKGKRKKRKNAKIHLIHLIHLIHPSNLYIYIRTQTICLLCFQRVSLCVSVRVGVVCTCVRVGLWWVAVETLFAPSCPRGNPNPGPLLSGCLKLAAHACLLVSVIEGIGPASIHPSIHPPIHLSIHPFIYPSIHLIEPMAVMMKVMKTIQPES